MEQTDIQEPWIRGNKIHGFGQLHNRLLYCKTGVAPRAAIYVSPDVKAMMLNQFTTDDVATMRVSGSHDFMALSLFAIRQESATSRSAPKERCGIL